MYCSTCGAHVPAGRTHCTTCGAAVTGHASHAHGGSQGTEALARTGQARAPVAVGHTCPRCGYTGEGISYFSKGSHIAGLIVLGLVSAGFMGAFALVYYLSFRDHQICPRCGKDWGSNKDLALAPRAPGLPNTAQPALPSGRGGGAAQGFSIALFLIAAILLIPAIAELEIVAFLAAAGFGAGGLFLQNVARKEREARRAALISSLQLPVLKLAAERRGRLTVTETAAALGWTLPRAEKVLDSLDDGLRVSSEVTNDGVIVYEFRELAHGPDRLPGPGA